MTDRFESILDESISALQAGVPIEEILAEVPCYASELRPLLYAATLLADPNPQLLPTEKKTALRQEYLKQVAELPTITPSPFSNKAQAILRIIKRRSTRNAVLTDLFTVVATLFLTLAVVGFTLNYLAIDAIPGDLLYPIKRISESVQLWTALDTNHRTELEDKFNQQRLMELEALLEQNRTAVIQFRGLVETKGENLWIIEGHTVLLSDKTSIQGNIQEGDTVEVNGLLQSNKLLIADTITKINPRNQAK